MIRRLTIKLTIMVMIGLFITNGHQAIAAENCAASLSSDFKLTIPEINFNNSIYSVDLLGVPSVDGAISFKVNHYEMKAKGVCETDSAFLVPNVNQIFAFLPNVLLGSENYQANFTLIPQSDNSLILKLDDYGQGGIWSGESGAINAASQFELLRSSDVELAYRQRFSYGEEAEVTLNLKTSQGEAVPTFSYNNINAEDYSFVFSYAVPKSLFSEDLLAKIVAATPKSLAGSRQAKATDSSVVVVVKGVIKSGGKKALETLVNSAFGKTATTILKAGGNILDVKNAYDTSEEHKKLMSDVDALDECAKNPPIPTSVEDIQKRIDAVNEARNRIKMHTASRFVMQGTAKAASLTPAKGIWPIIAGAKSYVEDAAKFLSKEELRIAQQFVPCSRQWVGSVLLRGQANDEVPSFEVETEVYFQEDPNTPAENGFVHHFIREGILTWKITSPHFYTKSSQSCTLTHSPSSGTIALKPTDGFLNVNMLQRTYLGSGSLNPITGINLRECCKDSKGKQSCSDFPGKSVGLELWFIPGDFETPLTLGADKASINGSYQLDDYTWRWAFERK